jgi:signal transduction histidine kinase
MTDKRVIQSGLYYIKPAANHILTIGKGIIKDSYTAILELVKNSYDADAETVLVKLVSNKGLTKITIEDDGHGMDFDTIINQWMVPSTSEKLRQKKSRYKKRPLQGRKGIGRYAASILGDDFSLKTIDCEKLATTELVINWNDFLKDGKYLEDIKLFIENYDEPFASQGTKLEISGNIGWTDDEIDELIRSLKMLLSPFDEADDKENIFNVLLEIESDSSKKFESFSEQIRPFPILDYYHYRISGTVSNAIEDGRKFIRAKLILENKHLPNILPKTIEKEIILRNNESYCGRINIDIRAYDLDELDELKFNDPLVNADEIKNIIRKQLPGIAVLRERFRVRPYGDRKNDWLSLNFRRFNNPTLRLSNNQVAGYIFVEQEETSHLEEKATREGFKENSYFEGLRTSIRECLGILEEYRYKFRRQHNKGTKRQKSIEEKLHDAADYSGLNEKITGLLTTAKVDALVSTQIAKVIDEEVKEKESQLQEIKTTIAQYQGQVTLGRIMSVVLHEGRKPLNALKRHPKFISEWSKEFVELLRSKYAITDESIDALIYKIIDRLNDNKQQAEIFSSIFKKLEPLANNKRSAAKEFLLKKPIDDAFKLYEYELSEKAISFDVLGDIHSTITGWEIDINIAFANIIENSIFWMENAERKHIEVSIKDENESILIEYSDTGSGIDEDNIAFQNIFDPGYSTKEDGTGLGLSIAGEALERNHGKISAISSTKGANFIIEIQK